MTALAAAVDRRAWLARIGLSEPDESGRVIVFTVEGPALRLPAALAAVLRAAQADPDRDPADIAAELGITPQQVHTVLHRVGATPSVSVARPRPALVQFRPPFTVQFALCDPSKLFRRDGRVAKMLRGRATWPALVTVNILAAVIAVVLVTSPMSPLAERLSVSAYGWLLFGFLVSMFIHESAHAAMLIAHGGKTRRMGFMLFYLAPAFFCDVRDSWSIPPRARMKVALAGVMAQGAVSALCGAAAFLTPPPISGALASLALLNILYWFFNLIPLVKFDGYVALAGYLDRPYLRDQSIGAFRDSVGAVLYGRARALPRVGPAWTLFGAASLLFPVVLVIGLVVSLGSFLSSLGVVAVWIELAAAAALAVWAALRVWRHIVVAWRGGNSRPRLLAVWTVGVAVVGAALTLVPIPQQQAGGVFFVGGTAQIGVLASGMPDDVMGGAVSVRRAGIVPGPVVATTTIAEGFRSCTIPLEAVVAVSAPDLSLSGHCARLVDSASLRRSLGALSAESADAALTLPSRTVVEYVGDLWRAATS